MDNSISLQIKRLIEIDRKAVELAQRRESEFQGLEEKHQTDIDKINGMLQAAREEAKRSYEEQVQQAHEEAEEVRARMDQKLTEVENAMSNAIISLTEEIWDKIMKDIK